MLCHSRTLRVLIAASTLLIGVPTWEHSHADGHQAHGHAHSHSHGHDHDVPRQAGVGHSNEHLHVVLLGIEFTLPALPNGEGSDSGAGCKLVPVPTLVDVMAPATTAAFCDQSVLSIAAPSLWLVDDLLRAAHVGAPLCDIARHERSGVQLI